MGWPFWGFFGSFLGFIIDFGVLFRDFNREKWASWYCWRSRLDSEWSYHLPEKSSDPFGMPFMIRTMTQSLPTPHASLITYKTTLRFRSTSKVLKSDLARTFSFSLKNPELQLWIIKAPNNTWKRGKKGVFLRYFGPPQKGSKTRAKREHFFLAVFFEKSLYLREPAFQGS